MTHARSIRAALALLAVLSVTAAHAGGADAPGGVTVLPRACRDGYVRPDFAALTRQLRAARARWAAAGVRDYTYDLHQIAAPVLFPDTRVSVRAGRAVSSAILPGQEGAPNQLARKTVEERFDDIARTLSLRRAAPCPEVRVSFDPRSGYPTHFYSGLGDAGIMDGFGEWTLTRLTPTR
ncbi:hypothetical protein HNQ07_003667 [Deinococcus metalli]|uniref:Uncharacterized protein n=1 Tax=Deinococcus metalli TaxID=1141878 RepID=A0A7W8KJM0_9DEIO|nr:DUF6174 domain-containing protein [Deinococcus metalli]MBB5378166.1 hypothetical protein [Deinococcus metalli]GHF56526.1 hypothetical protein GCM10017781_36050 [Deinococcus metalli]